MTEDYPIELLELRKRFITEIQEQAEAYYKEAVALITEKCPNARFQTIVESFCGETWSRLSRIFSSQCWDYAEFHRLSDKELKLQNR
ncbi:MAG: hypothetical protein ACFE9L_08815 [Candidatus Hodarchaeota archaeon]